MSVLMTPSDPERWDAQGPLFLANLVSTLVPARMTKFGIATWEEHVSKGSAMPPLQGVGQRRPQNFWDPYLCPYTV